MKYFPYGKNNENIFHSLSAEEVSILQRQRETNKNSRDEWGNWDGQFLQDTKTLEEPILDYNLMNFRPETWKKNGSFCLLISHDIDTLNEFSIIERVRRIHRTTYNNLGYGKKESSINYNKLILLLGLIRRFIIPGLQVKGHWDFKTWIDCEESYGFRSTWFVFPENLAIPTDEDCSYRWQDKVGWTKSTKIPFIEAMSKLDQRGHEIGLHASLYAAMCPKTLKSEKKHLENALGKTILSIRQHYLRYDPIKTPSTHEQAGFKIDSTIGMNRFVGFRNGTSRPHFTWCPLNKRFTNVIEFPLNLQDGALLSPSMLNLGYSKALDKSKEIMSKVEKVGGSLNILFHPNVQKRSEYWDLFENILEEAKKRGAWGPTMKEARSQWLGLN